MKIYYSSTYKRSVAGALISIAMGFVLLLWPAHVLNYTVQIIGAVFCIIGIVSLVMSLRENRKNPSGLASVTGIGSIVLGLVLWFMSDTFTSLLMYLLGFVLLVMGIVQLTSYLSARKFGHIPFVSYLFPIVLLLMGLLILGDPNLAKETIIMLFGGAAVFYGITDLISQGRINKMRQNARQEEQRERLGGTAIEDTTFEEVE